jgi:hypothetical protein
MEDKAMATTEDQKRAEDPKFGDLMPKVIEKERKRLAKDSSTPPSVRDSLSHPNGGRA